MTNKTIKEIENLMLYRDETMKQGKLKEILDHALKRVREEERKRRKEEKSITARENYKWGKFVREKEIREIIETIERENIPTQGEPLEADAYRKALSDIKALLTPKEQ